MKTLQLFKHMGNWAGVLFLLLLGTISMGVNAQVSDSLSTYLQLAAQNSPMLKSRFMEYSAALEKVPQVGALPDPQLTFSAYVKPMELMGGNQVATIQLMQMFPWFGTLAAARDEMSMMAKAKLQQVELEKQQLFYEVKQQWFSLYLNKENIQVTQQSVALLKVLENIVLAQYSAGGGAPANTVSSMGKGTTSASVGGTMSGAMNGGAPKGNSTGMSPSAGGGMGVGTSLADLLSIRMQLKDLENRLQLYTDRQNTLTVKFNSLLNRESDTPVALPDTVLAMSTKVSMDALLDTILANNPMVKMFSAEGESYGAMAKKASRMGYPMVGLGFSYMVINPRSGNASPMNGNDMVMPMVSVTLPIYRKKYGAMRREAELLQQSATDATDDARNKLTAEFAQAKEMFRDANRRVTLNEEQATLAGQTLNLLLAGYSVSTSSLNDVLRMEQQLLDYRFATVQAVVDQQLAVAMLEKLAAQPFYESKDTGR